MKNYEKLLIVMLCITVITTILSVSVCAEETHEISGVWKLNSKVDVSTKWTETVNLLLPNYNNKRCYGLSVYNIGAYGANVPIMGFLKEDGTKLYLSQDPKDEQTATPSNSMLLLDFGKDSQQVSENFYNYINSNATYYSDSTTSFLCDGSTCPATDMNYDNICDDCGMAFTFNLRNDTYDFNGFYLPSAIEDESGVIVNLNNYWNETLSKNDGNLVILNGDSTDNALLYHFSPDVVFSDGQVVTTGKTEVTLYKPSTNENGYLYWKKSATDTWNTSGALVASVEHVDWVANAVTDENGYTAINGDLNFQTPLWVEIQGVTEGEMTVQLPKMGGTMKILVVCGVGLMACLVVLSLFGKRSLIFRN